MLASLLMIHEFHDATLIGKATKFAAHMDRFACTIPAFMVQKINLESAA